MKIANLYNHLNGYEYLLVHKKELWDQLSNAITEINADDYIKISKDKAKTGRKLFDQKGINDKFKEILTSRLGWQELKKHYYVTSDIETEREIVKLKDDSLQKEIIEEKGLIPYKTNNQIDFVKDRVAIEVQFGKYFSVAYDLHVKHTFFYLTNEIDVGIEIIPTHKMMKRMDTGVAWFENEVANVIREGRSNPTVPIVILGIEPDSVEHIDNLNLINK